MSSEGQRNNFPLANNGGRRFFFTMLREITSVQMSTKQGEESNVSQSRDDKVNLDFAGKFNQLSILFLLTLEVLGNGTKLQAISRKAAVYISATDV